ncbi:MAG: hypothetical protein KAX38_10135, partial [Candidatus Krumholzibacteria bacterium]|nr:hypothetical protein [Candidatus Krumholzibacteria bacterium]
MGEMKHPRGRPLGTYQRGAFLDLLEGRFTCVDSLSLLAVRVSFSDRDFNADVGDTVVYDSLYFANELRHLEEYFLGASCSRFILSWELSPGIVKLDRPEGYYGEDGVWEERVVELLMEVVQATDSLIDYSLYDALAIIHAGTGQETDFNGDSPEQLWSGFVDPGEMEEILADTLGTPGVPTDDSLGGEPYYVDNMMVWPEKSSQDGFPFGSLGVYAYQVGLRLGMIPLFDTTPSGFLDSQGIGSLGLMGYGLYNALGIVPAFPCAFHRYLMGWVEPLDISEDCNIRLKDINSFSPLDTSLVRIPVNATEYFMIANRVHDTNFNGRFDFGDVEPVREAFRIPGNEDTLLGAEFDFFLTATTNPTWHEENPDSGFIVKKTITGSGLMIWHIDETIIIRALESGRYPEDNPVLKGVDLEEADGIQDLDRPGGSYAFGSYYG